MSIRGQNICISNDYLNFSDIPHFKEVVIMATVCEYCGHKTNEVKSGGGIESKGKRIILNVTDPSDMSRDVLKVLIFDQLCKNELSLKKCRPSHESSEIELERFESISGKAESSVSLGLISAFHLLRWLS